MWYYEGVVKLTFKKPPPKKAGNINVRAHEGTQAKLKALADHYGVSQADVIEKLIEVAHADLKRR